MWEETLEVLGPDWGALTYRDPLDPASFPITSPFWSRCRSGAQKAGLVRLEALWFEGGVYLDSDVRLWKSPDPLLTARGFVIQENEWAVIDAVIGAEAGHPFLLTAIGVALSRLLDGQNELHTGPRAVHDAAQWLPEHLDVLPPVAFCPFTAWQDRKTAETLTAADCPDSYGLHLCRNSWGG